MKSFHKASFWARECENHANPTSVNKCSFSQKIGALTPHLSGENSTDQSSLMPLGDRMYWHSVFISMQNQLTIFMNNILYLIAVVLIIGWLLGVFVYSLTGIIHVLLVIALVSILLQVIRGRR